MIVGLTPFTWFHTLLSLVALLAGIAVVAGMMSGKAHDRWVPLFLVTAVLTSVTGFMFPFDRFLPSHWIGVLSLIALAAAVAGRYVFGSAGPWRTIVAMGIVVAVYLDAFVTVAQAFSKVPALRALAPTQSEPPFAIAEGLLLLLFVWIGYVVLRRARNGLAVA